MSEVRSPPHDDRPSRPADSGELRTRSVLEFLPKRSLARIVLMIVLLVGIFVLRQRAGSVIRSLGDVVFPPPPSTAPPAGGAPRVRMAPSAPMPPQEGR